MSSLTMKAFRWFERKEEEGDEAIFVQFAVLPRSLHSSPPPFGGFHHLGLLSRSIFDLY